MQFPEAAKATTSLRPGFKPSPAAETLRRWDAERYFVAPEKATFTEATAPQVAPVGYGKQKEWKTRRLI